MESHMSLEVRSTYDNGLLFYAGPSSIKPSPLSVQGNSYKSDLTVNITTKHVFFFSLSLSRFHVARA